MEPNTIIDERFEILSLARTGGMGSVYRAVDRSTGQQVALKLLHDTSDDYTRFRHEARILASIAHPHVVPFVAYGSRAEGQPYIAMEWIEGESLTERLSREALTMAETIALARGVTSALVTAHAQGIVHRDLKPSNLMLPDCEVAAVKIVDFGTARLAEFHTTITRSGAILGTPGYMAPEQARGDEDVGSAADIFSLGCILFECLAGKPAFEGLRPIALLAKLLLEDAPSLLEVRPGLPEVLASLVQRMLAKEPSERPRDGAAMANELDLLDERELSRKRLTMRPPSPADTRRLHSLTNAEQRLIAIVAVGTASSSLAPIPPTGPKFELQANVRRAIESRGARVESLADGTVLVVLASRGSPTDQAAEAARAALQIRLYLPHSPIALAMGRGEADRRLPMGEALERVVALLVECGDTTLVKPESILIDDLARALIEERFDVRNEGANHVLRGEWTTGDEPRLLLRKPTPFVGRDRVISNLLGSIDDAIDEPRSTALLVSAGAGMGKSRLRQELTLAIRAQQRSFTVLVGRGDVIAVGSPFSMIGSALRGAFGIEGGEPPEIQRQKLVRAVEAFVDGSDARNVAEFLGEALGTPFPDELSPRLRAARQDAQAMAARIEAAFIHYVRGTLARNPLLLIFDDLHWGDAASVRIVDVALRALAEQPFIVLAFARPEVHDRFPRLWSGRQAQEILLQPLARRACAELTLSALGELITPQKLQAIVERSEGNAFYLEELIRTVAEFPQGGGLPKTVLGMIEARLARLHPDARRTLRAASVFGSSCWRNGVFALLGEEDETHGSGFDMLLEGELLVRSNTRRFSNEEEYTFRHELIREASYAMLTERDRRLGHRLAGAWLEKMGEIDPAILAEHFEQGGEGERATHYYLQAAEQALRAGDYDATLSMAAEGIKAAGHGEIPSGLWALQAEAAYWGGNCELALSSALEALGREPPGTSIYCRALLGAVGGALLLQRPVALREATTHLYQVEPTRENVVMLAQAFLQLVNAFVVSGGRNAAEPFLTRMRETCGPFMNEEPAVAGCIEHARGTFARWGEQNPFAALTADRAAKRHFEQVGYQPLELQCTAFIAMDLTALGALDEADQNLATILDRAASDNLSLAQLVARNHFAILRLAHREAAIAEAYTRETIVHCARQGEALHGKAALLILVEALLDRGEIEVAGEELEKARASGPGTRHLDGWTRTLEAALLLRQGQCVEAARAAEAALATARVAGVYWPRHVLAELTLIEALIGGGDRSEARHALRNAQHVLLLRADEIEDPAYCKTFLEGVREHVRILELAQQWVNSPDPPSSYRGTGPASS
jgi:serine/threonine protein kinase